MVSHEIQDEKQGEKIKKKKVLVERLEPGITNSNEMI